MNKKIILFSLFIFVTLAGCSSPAFPPETHSESIDPKKVQQENARLWASTVKDLYQKQKWGYLRDITPLSSQFKDDVIWKEESFQSLWVNWQKENSVMSWSQGSVGASVWKLSEGNNPLRPSIGVRKEQSGLWWIVLVQPKSEKNFTHDGWICDPSCNITIRSNGKEKIVSAVPPLHEEWKRVYTVGFPIPYDMIGASNQKWEVSLPIDSSSENKNMMPSAVFDMSYMGEVCRHYFGTCARSY